MTNLPRTTLGRRADLPNIPEIAAELTEQTASCTLPTGETITVSHRLPLYTLARELDAKGYGDYRLQSYSPTGTPSLRGLVSVMAGLTSSLEKPMYKKTRSMSAVLQPLSPTLRLACQVRETGQCRK